MKIQDHPCEFEDSCKAPVELLNKKFDREKMQWMGFYVCLNKHYYMKKVDILVEDTDYDFLSEGIQEELPFSDGNE